MNAAERQVREQEILRLWIAGASYARIGQAIGLSSRHVDRIVKKALAAGAQRRALLAEEALALHQERHERLFEAHWVLALKGDHRSAELCRRLLDQNARLHGLYADAAPSLPAPTAQLGATEGGDQEAPQDELSQLRSRRTGGG